MKQLKTSIQSVLTGLVATLCSVYLTTSLSTPAFASPVSTVFSKSSPSHKNVLVELFTSDGCDSCPPANQWVSRQIKTGDHAVIPLSMHVTYWNSLGWVDPASHVYFDRKQAEYTRLGLARFSYTPAVFLSGSEWSGWREHESGTIKAIQAQPATLGLVVTAEMISPDKVTVQVEVNSLTQAAKTDGKRLKQFVYLYEDGVTEQPSAGELRGVTLHHDHVVRAWDEHVLASLPSKTAIELAIPKGHNVDKLGLVSYVQSEDGREVFQVLDVPLRQE